MQHRPTRDADSRPAVIEYFRIYRNPEYQYGVHNSALLDRPTDRPYLEPDESSVICGDGVHLD